ncbi:MAG: lipopolysaccharide biosynthesis protein [Rhodospirillales bacterium]|jgi:O-antigen/teichoic acid export membrane protein
MKAGWFSDLIFRRVFKNAGFLLSGKVATGVFGLAYLSLAARGLGIEQFGLLVLVQTYVQVITGLTTFHSWQAVIRYGAISVENDDTPGFQKLISFTTALDIGGVILGAIVAWFAAPLVGPVLGWSDEVIAYAQPYSLLILFTVIATPTGLLRLYDRFDILAWQVVITPATRLIGVTAAVLLDAPLWGYLLAWFVAGVVGGLTLVALGWREGVKQGRLNGMRWSLTGVTTTHTKIWSFCLASNFHSSLQMVTGHMSTLLVGAVATPAAAGLFKVAREVATALTKPAELLTQSIYPEFARLGSTGVWSAFGGLIRRAATLAGSAGLTVLIIMILLGKPFLALVFGPDFSAAYGALVLLVAAAVITISGFSFDPALYAMGRPSVPLKVNVIVVLCVYVPLLVLLTEGMGPLGAGVAMLVSASLIVGTMGLWTRKELRKRF